MYNGEDVIFTRFDILYDVVDRFYVTEGATSFSGNRKERLFKDVNAESFAPYQDKIRWVIYDEAEDTWETGGGEEQDAKIDAIERSGKVTSELIDLKEESRKLKSFRKEERIRSFVLTVLEGDLEKRTLVEPFVVIMADVDEIPDPNVVIEFQPGGLWHSAAIGKEATGLVMDSFYYNFNWKMRKTWLRAYILPGNLAISGEKASYDTSIKDFPKTILNAGWHCSFFSSLSKIKYKIESFSHTELDKDLYKSNEHILDCITNGNDLFMRKDALLSPHDYMHLPLPLQKFHERVVKKQNTTRLRMIGF